MLSVGCVTQGPRWLSSTGQDQIRQMATVSIFFSCVCNCVIAAPALLCLTARSVNTSPLSRNLNNKYQKYCKLLMEAHSLHLLPELIFVGCEGMFDCPVVMRSAVNINCLLCWPGPLISSYKRGEERMARGGRHRDNLWDPVILSLSPHTPTVTKVNVCLYCRIMPN